jgi:long-chain acyl-CoA synthetase
MTVVNLGDVLQINGSESKKIVFFDGSVFHTTSYSELDQQAQYLAQGLIRQGLTVGDCVAIVSGNSLEFLTVMLGTLKMGATVVLIDVQAPATMLDQLLTNTGAQLVFSDRHIDTVVPTIDLKHGLGDFLVSQQFESIVPEPDAVALMLHTSGSTGQPKIIKVTHTNFLSRIQDRPPASQTSLISTPYHHMNGLFQMQRALAAGCDLVGMHRFNADDCLKLIDCCQVKTITSIPTVMSLLVRAADANDYELTTVNTVIVSSAPMSRNLFDTVKQTFSRAKVLIRYGSTEGGPGMFVEHPTLATPDMSVGYPNPNIQYRLVDQVLQIRSPYMAVNSDQQPQSFTKDGWFVTNDLFRVDQQGFYYFLGRADDMFVCGGQNIYPRHIESVLESHDDVVLSAVVGVEDEVKGVKPYAFVTVKSPSTVNQLQLQTYMRGLLPANFCPREIWIVDQLPTLGNDKIDRSQLKKLAQTLLG